MALIFILLYAPIVTLVVLSFNASKTRAKWGGFTLHWYRSLFANTEIMNALYTTLIIALLASAIATVLGTLACIGINSMSKKSRTVFMGITNIPMLNGEIVMGISLMLLFIICRIQLGFGTILMAHITFNVPYVILSVMPKLKQTNKSTYEAALDLGASPLYAFWKVIFPDIMPGVVSGFLLSFTMSLDDFVITYFTKGPGVDTLSTKIYAEVRKGIKPEMYSLSTILFVTVLLLLLLVNVNPSPKEEKEEAKEREAMAKKGIRFRITKRVVFRRILPIAMVLVIGGGGIYYGSQNASAGGSQQLIVYNWGEYMDSDVIDIFEEETGIHVVYEEYETNEIMYPKIKSGAISYDLVCPSDYMIQKMIQNDLVESYNGDMAKRDSMHNAQCLAGMAFSNALLGIVHSMAHKTGAAFADYGAHIIHGAANAMYLPKVIAFNAKDPEAKKRYGVIADEMKLGGTTDDEKVKLLIEHLRGMNDALNIPHCIQHYGPDSYPTEQGFVPEEVFLERLPEIAKNAIADACTGSNPRQPSQEEMEKLLKCCYYDTEVDF